VDDIPVLFALLKQLRLAELLEEHFPRHHLWKGELTFGDVVATWITFILSQGDHRLCCVEPWARQNLCTLQSCLGKTVRPLDFHDDRLADVLDTLTDAQRWQSFETDLNHGMIRVYDLKPHVFRIDTTTASSYAQVRSEEGMLQFGHSKDNDHLPQVKIAATTLDPLGVPITTVVVPGHKADDPLYVPEIQKVNAIFGAGGKTFFGDCKMAALGTRAYAASTKDYYLCPLSPTQLSGEQRLALLAPVLSGTQQLKPVYRPAARPDEEPELVARGFSYDVALSATVGKRCVRWKERRWVVQSSAFAHAQAENLETRLEKATTQVGQLHQRKQGKKRLSVEETNATVQEILKKHRVEGLLDCQVRTTTIQEKVLRRYGKRPEQRMRDDEHRVETSRREEVIARTKEEMGWQVYATNNLKLNAVSVVWGYRGQYRIEDGWARLKGRPLSLSPMYLADENRMVGLVLLLSLALRALTLLEWVVRRKLQESNETLEGVYPGQAGRKTSTPSAEMLLKVFRGVSLSVVDVAGRVSVHVTELTPVQKRLLKLWGFPKNLFQRLTLHCSENPPPLSER
jgi:transposase